MLIRETASDGRLFRIVHADEVGETLWLFDLHDKTWPTPYHREQLRTAFLCDAPSLKVEYDEPFPVRHALDKTDSAADRAHDRQWKIITELLSNNGAQKLLYRSTRKAAIDKTAETIGVTRPTVVAAIMRYWQRGMTFNAVRPDYAKCGGPGKLRNIDRGVKVGRPRNIAPGIGVSVDDALRRWMQIGADHYFRMKRRSLPGALEYVARIKVPEKLEELLAGKRQTIEELPTLRQFGYFVRQTYPLSRRYRGRFGQKQFDLTARPITGKAEQNAIGPGDRFEVDATVADVYLRSRFDRRRIVGRPIIYFVIDAWSRLIVGLYIGFEGPSWIGAMMALTNMITPKVEFCREFGVDIEPHEWPSHHAPRTILADRGELMNVRTGQKIEELGIAIGNTSPGRGDLKSIVESRFRIVPSIFGPFTPGYVEPDFNTRGARDYRLESAMNLDEFTKIVIEAVLEHNQEPVDGIEAPTEMTTEGLDQTPINRWNWGIPRNSGSLSELSLDEIALAVMPLDKARVTEKGIRFKGGYYTCDLAERDEWFHKARSNGEWPVDVSYDPRSLEKLYIWQKQLATGYEACKLLRSSLDRHGMSLSEVEEKGLAARRLEASGDAIRLAKRVRTDAAMEQIEKAAKAEAKALDDPNASNASRLSGIRENRAEEKQRQRSFEKFDLAPEITPPTAPAAPHADESTDRHRERFRALLKQQDGDDE